MNQMKYLKMAAALLAGNLVMTACDNDDPASDNGDSQNDPNPSAMRFVVASGDPATDLTGGIVMKLYTNLNAVREGEQVYADTLAGSTTTKSYDTFTQVTYNPVSGIYTGYVYARGASAQGLGAKKAGLRSYKVQDGKLVEAASPVYLSNFGNTGIFSTCSYAAQISQPYAVVIDQYGAGTTKELPFLQYAIDGVNPNTSNIVDLGDNRVAIVVNYANRDSAAVVFADYSLKPQGIVYDGRIGASVGAQRSVRYTQSGCDDEGNLYVFCGTGVNGDATKVGALRINKGASAFDTTYKFDLYTASGGYRFRKAFHISGDKFLIDFYTDKAAFGNMNASGKLAVVDMSDQTLLWVSGSEYLTGENTTASIGWGDGYQGFYYLPVAAGTTMSGGKTSGTLVPTIFKIDASTGKATPFMTFASSDLLKMITILK